MRGQFQRSITGRDSSIGGSWSEKTGEEKMKLRGSTLKFWLSWNFKGTPIALREQTNALYTHAFEKHYRFSVYPPGTLRKQKSLIELQAVAAYHFSYNYT